MRSSDFNITMVFTNNGAHSAQCCEHNAAGFFSGQKGDYRSLCCVDAFGNSGGRDSVGTVQLVLYVAQFVANWDLFAYAAIYFLCI